MTSTENIMMKWLAESPCNFYAIETIRQQLDEVGFIGLDAGSKWNLVPGGAYYLIKNGTAIFAFIVGNKPTAEAGFRIIASHSDSPCFKLKPSPEIIGDGGLVSLNVEKYGGAIMSTWFDRPLSIAGRVMLRGSDPLTPISRLINLQRPVCTIPNLAIHFNRQVNDGVKLSVQKDMKPIMGRFTPKELEYHKNRGGIIRSVVAETLKVDPAEILDTELMLYPVEKPTIVSYDNDLFQSARIDDLSMAFASLEALLKAKEKNNHDSTLVMAVFDNEETGSGTKQGAASPVLATILRRISEKEEQPVESFARAVEHSFMISADNAHAWHPNYTEKYDPTNHPIVGEGPVVKINANCKYMTDAQGSAIFKALCDKAGVTCQYFVNHGDVAGGSTLGNILTSQIDLRGVDMGCGIWGMHSAAETGSLSDYSDTVKVFSSFWE